MGKSKRSNRIALTAAAFATILCATARAEYRCATPQQLDSAETRACQLAQQDTPEALIRFVNRTKAIYNLYVNDYVSEADVQRWEMAKQKAEPDSASVAKAAGATKREAKND